MFRTPTREASRSSYSTFLNSDIYGMWRLKPSTSLRICGRNGDPLPFLPASTKACLSLVQRAGVSQAPLVISSTSQLFFVVIHLGITSKVFSVCGHYFKTHITHSESVQKYIDIVHSGNAFLCIKYEFHSETLRECFVDHEGN